MERITNSIKAYRETFSNRNDNKGAFFATDIEELKKFTQAALMEKGYTSMNPAAYLSDIILNALEAGFMVGYRCAKNEARKTNTKKK